MKVVAMVPIKLNSERLPNKNIKYFDNGNPLISYILGTLKDVSDVDEIYVYCSDKRICDYIPKGIKFLERSELLDRSCTKINEVLSSFAKEVQADVYVLSHATSPFIKSSSIKKGLYEVLNGNYDSALSVLKLQEFLWKEGKPFNYDPSEIPRTQDLDVMYSETSGFYIYKRDLIEKQNRRIGYRPYLVEVSKIEAVDIDEEEDFFIANSVVNHINKE